MGRHLRQNTFIVSPSTLRSFYAVHFIPSIQVAVPAAPALPASLPPCLPARPALPAAPTRGPRRRARPVDGAVHCTRSLAPAPLGTLATFLRPGDVCQRPYDCSGGGTSSGQWRPGPAVWLGSARLGSARLGSARLGSVRLGSVRLGSAQLGSAWPDSAQIDSARLGSTRLGSARLGSAQLGSARLSSAQLGSARLGTVRLDWDHDSIEYHTVPTTGTVGDVSETLSGSDGGGGGGGCGGSATKPPRATRRNQWPNAVTRCGSGLAESAAKWRGASQTFSPPATCSPTSMARWFVHSFVRSFVHSFVRSFARSFARSWTLFSS